MTYVLTLFAEAPILIDGQHSSFTVDKSTARKSHDKTDTADEKSKPFIPASAIKGALRIEFERLIRSIDSSICYAPDPKTMCKPPTQLCLACRLFGGPNSRAGKLRFHDALLQSTFRQDAYANRMGVSLSRQLRKVEGKKLYSQEAAPPNLKYRGAISLLDGLIEDERDKFEKVLAWCEMEGLCIGGNRSRGMGRLALHVGKSDAILSPPSSFTPSAKRKVYKVSFAQDTNQEEPMRVSPHKTGSYLLKCLDYLPGSTVRGAAAWGWKRQGLSEDQVSDLILHHSRFSHLYPDDLSEIRPATAVKCKQQPEDHGPFDTLLLRFLLNCAEQTDNAKALLSLWEGLDSCPFCEGSLTVAERFKQSADRQLMIKLGLNRYIGHAKEAFFYIYETLDSRTTYTGFLHADEGIKALGPKLPVYIGGARGKGFGKGMLTIDAAPADFPGDAASIKKRAERFQDRLHKLAAERGYGLTLPENRWYFSLMLLTDLVLPPNLTLQDMLAQEGWQWETAQLGWTRRGGFNEAAGQSKPLVPMLDHGGAVLLSVSDDEASISRLLARLTEVETEGVGLLREQGYGWIYSNHDFHCHSVIPNKEKTDGTRAS